MYLCRITERKPGRRTWAERFAEKCARDGKPEEDLEVQIGDLKESVTVKVSEEKYTKEELENVFEEAARKLETLILEEQKSG